jgi:PIN domain nuclease of toxin-antitoxin system
LDTHAFLWWVGDTPSLSPVAREIISDGSNDIYLSAVSVWEISIKARVGRLDVFSGDIEVFVEQQVQRNSFMPLPISLAHSAKVFTLSNHHRDPFDQMLVAQSQVENLTLVSADRMIRTYDVNVVW